MMIDPCEPQIFERPGAQRVDQAVASRLDIELAARHLFEEILQVFV